MDLIECKDKIINRHPWELSRTECLIKEIKKYHIGNSIIDIGCGDSYFDYRLMEQIDNINKFYGIDIYADEEIKDGKYCVLNDYSKLKNKKFDTVIMFDVLEHIEDDIDFLKNTVNNLLKDKGKIIMTVPAYQSLFSKHDVKLKHFRRYNIKTLSKVAEKSSFKVINYHYFYFSLIPLRIISKLLNRDNKINNWSKNEKHICTRIVKNVLNLDYAIGKKLNKFSSGLSLFVVLEKK